VEQILGMDSSALPEAGGVPRRSRINRVDARSRIIAAVIFALVIVALDDLVVLSLGLGVALVLMTMAQMPVGQTLRRMIMMDSFIIVMLALLPFTVSGQPIFALFGFTASWEGLIKAAQIGLKANAIILALMSLVGSMEPVTLGYALRRLCVPQRLVSLILFTIRYLDVLHQEYQRLRAAMKARGFRPRNSRHTYRSLGYLVGMMLVRAVDRSERILEAMKCRGFTGNFPMIDTLAYSRSDAVFGLVMGAAMIGLVVLQTASPGGRLFP